jgi:N-dimethylarginine dimethylaminohydrolase
MTVTWTTVFDAAVAPETKPEVKPAPALARQTFAVGAVQCAQHEASDVCRYQVAYSINPHMIIGAVDFAIASHQHAALMAVLAGSGVSIEHLPFVHGAYDSVFVKDPALLLTRGGQKRALLARLRYPERQRESAERARVLAHQGYEVVTGCESDWEGGDVIMLPSCEGMFLGYGLRSCREAAKWLERHADIEVMPIELRDPHLYHLDTALAVLPDGTTLVCPDALTREGLREVERARGLSRVMYVTRELALDFGLNLLTIGDTVVVGAYQPELQGLLASLGYRYHAVPLGQFHLAGGSAACLVAPVYRCREGT